jgi:hypothetical protein
MKEAGRRQLALILEKVDETFLVALANKGLLRRALKALETASLQIEESDDCLLVRGSDWTVRMPAGGPAHARDDTKASGVTWQILAATIHLRDHWCAQALGQKEQSRTTAEPQVACPPESYTERSSCAVEPAGPTEPATLPTVPAKSGVLEEKSGTSEKPPAADAGNDVLLQSLLEITADDLNRWAGKKLFSEVMALAGQPVELELDYSLGLTIKLAGKDLELRLLNVDSNLAGSKLLDQILSTAPKSLHKHCVLTAILALNHKYGRDLQLPSSPPEESFEAPRSRPQVLEEARLLLETMLATGLCHASTRMVERLFTLSISASAVKLPRVAHLLQTLATEVSLLLNRDAASDTQRLFSSMSWTYSLVQAIEKAGSESPRELVGEARSQYDPVPDLHLSGLSAFPWQTASGYQGLTLLFWDCNNKRILSWSASRKSSAGTAQFNVQQIYQTGTIWTGGGSPQRLCRSIFALKQARLNPVGRISASQQSSVDNLQALPAELDFGERLFKDWTALQTYAASQFPIGLKLRNPLDRIVVLEPAAWAEKYFDEMQQAFCWRLNDRNSQSLLLTLPWNETNESSIEFMESLKPERERIARVVARISLLGMGFAMEPLSFIARGQSGADDILNPAFDRNMIESRLPDLLVRLRKKFGFDRVATAMTSDDEWESTMQKSSIHKAVPVPIRNAILETEGLLLQLAESGTPRLREETDRQFKSLGKTLRDCGLLELGLSIESIAAQERLAERLLQTDYLCQLHWQAVTQSFRF